MRNSRTIQISLLCITLLFVIPMISYAGQAASDQKVLYSMNFSSDPKWNTNSEESYFWDNQSGRYHYLMEGTTNGYSGIDLPEPITGSFTLEFDVTPVKTDEEGIFRFGIGNNKKSSQSGPLVLAELSNKKNGKLFYLTTITKENLISSVGSSPVSGKYEGNTVRFEDNTSYHIRINYYDEDKRASITVRDGKTDAVLFAYFIQVNGKMEEFTNLFLTSIGEGTMGPKAEGYIDNIVLTVPSAIPAPVTTAVETPTPTLAPEMGSIATPTPTLAPISTKKPLPTPPPVTTHPSGPLPIIVIPGIAGAVWILKKNKKGE